MSTSNIAEYIIEMYRKEDMLRAYHLNLEKFGNQVINFFPINSKEKLVQINFYEEMINKMKVQGIQQSGHLMELKELTNSLSRLHDQLKLHDQSYAAVYRKAQAYIIENINHAQGKVNDEIQICLNGVYGFLLLKIEDRPISPDEQKMVDAFGDILSLLSYKYEEKKHLN